MQMANYILSLSKYDEEKSADERTMKLVQEIGNDIHQSIQVEIDYSSRYDDKKMPTLDLKVWIEETDIGCRIMHEHYTKPMSSTALLDAR